MSNQTQSIWNSGNESYGLPYQIFIMIFAIFISYTFARISYNVVKRIVLNSNQLKRLKEHGNGEQKNMLYPSIIYWITISIKSLIKAIFLHNLIIPYSDSCVGIQSSSCAQCDIFGRIYSCLFTLDCGAKLIALTATFKIFKMNLDNGKDKELMAYQLWIVVYCAIVMIYKINMKFGLSKLGDSNSKYICQQRTYWRDSAFPYILGSFGFITNIIVPIWFVYKLYLHTLSLKSKSKLRRMDRDKAKSIINWIIHYAIIICFSTLITLMSRLTILILDIELLGDLINGLLILMLFDFGSTKYQIICGKLHNILYNKWMDKHRMYLPKPKAANGKSPERSISNWSKAEDYIKKRSPSSLSTIIELTEENSKLSTIPEEKLTLTISSKISSSNTEKDLKIQSK